MTGGVITLPDQQEHKIIIVCHISVTCFQRESTDCYPGCNKVDIEINKIRPTSAPEEDDLEVLLCTMDTSSAFYKYSHFTV